MITDVVVSVLALAVVAGTWIFHPAAAAVTALAIALTILIIAAGIDAKIKHAPIVAVCLALGASIVYRVVTRDHLTEAMEFFVGSLALSIAVEVYRRCTARKSVPIQLPPFLDNVAISAAALIFGPVFTVIGMLVGSLATTAGIIALRAAESGKTRAALPTPRIPFITVTVCGSLLLFGLTTMQALPLGGQLWLTIR